MSPKKHGEVSFQHHPRVILRFGRTGQQTVYGYTNLPYSTISHRLDISHDRLIPKQRSYKSIKLLNLVREQCKTPTDLPLYTITIDAEVVCRYLIQDPLQKTVVHITSWRSS